MLQVPAPVLGRIGPVGLQPRVFGAERAFVDVAVLDDQRGNALWSLNGEAQADPRLCL